MILALDAVFGKDYFTISQRDAFVRYYEMLIEWNSRFNLTRIVDAHDAAEKHYYDSLTGLSLIPEGANVLDVGSGAGFPAIPLAIMRPDSSFTLMEATGKKATFLTAVATELRLTTVHVLNMRAEDVTPDMRERYDVVTARAVARLNTLAEYCMPYLRVGGVFVAYKANAKEEIDEAGFAIRTLGGRLTDVTETSLPSGDTRTLVTVTKVTPTPTKYPRGQGKPRSKPLI